jgi:hypothetical protein
MVSSLIPSARKLALVLAAGAAFSAAMLWNGKVEIGGALVSSSEARIGRPLTPMSYAATRGLWHCRSRRGRRLCRKARLRAGDQCLWSGRHSMLTDG